MEGARRAGTEMLHAQSSFFGQVLQPIAPLLRHTGRRCGDMRRLLHKRIPGIKGHGTVLAAMGAVRKHQARLCRVPQLRI